MNDDLKSILAVTNKLNDKTKRKYPRRHCDVWIKLPNGTTRHHSCCMEPDHPLAEQKWRTVIEVITLGVPYLAETKDWFTCLNPNDGYGNHLRSLVELVPELDCVSNKVLALEKLNWLIDNPVSEEYYC